MAAVIYFTRSVAAKCYGGLLAFFFCAVLMEPKIEERKVISCTTLISFKLRIIEVRSTPAWSMVESRRVESMRCDALALLGTWSKRVPCGPSAGRNYYIYIRVKTLWDPKREHNYLISRRCSVAVQVCVCEYVCECVFPTWVLHMRPSSVRHWHSN